MQLNGLNVVVTGGASGMGRAFSLKFASQGANVAACDMNQEGLDNLVAESEGLPGTIRGYKANVANEDEVIAFFDAAWSDFGSLNALVNNAGIFRDGLLVKKDRETGPVKKMSLKNWQMVLDVDLTGPFSVHGNLLNDTLPMARSKV